MFDEPEQKQRNVALLKPSGAKRMDKFNEEAIDLFRIEELEERLEMQTTCSGSVSSDGTCTVTVSHTFDW